MNMGWIKNIDKKNILTLLLSIIVSIFILELFLKVYNPFQFRVKGNRIILQSNAKYTVKNHTIPKLDKVIVHTKNSLGFRGSEPPQNFDEYLSIITIGGSTTECRLLSDGKDWANILKRELDNSFKKVWLNNAGLDGHTTFGHTVLMEDYVTKKYKPKIVLFLIGLNDTGRKKLSTFDKYNVKREKDETIAEYFKSKVNLLAEYSEILNSIIGIYRYNQARRGELTHRPINLLEYKQAEISEDKSQQLIKKHTEDYLPYYKKRLKYLVELSKNNGIEPILITQPVLFGDAIDDVTGVNLAKISTGKVSGEINWEMDINGEVSWKVLELYHSITREVGKEEDVLVIDLAKEMPKSSKYYYDFVHYTNEGAEVVGKIVYKYMCPFIQNKFPEYSLGGCK